MALTGLMIAVGMVTELIALFFADIVRDCCIDLAVLCEARAKRLRGLIAVVPLKLRFLSEPAAG